MTNQEALRIAYSKRKDSAGEERDFLNTIIKALEQKPCEDAISRTEVLDLIDSKDPNYEVRHFKEDVECLPSVSTEKTGRWELVYRDCGIEYYLCSKCHEGKVAIDGDYYKNITEFIYCPSCGARLEVEG